MENSAGFKLNASPGGFQNGAEKVFSASGSKSELLAFPYLCQQAEFVMGGDSSRHMFLAPAGRQILNGE